MDHKLAAPAPIQHLQPLKAQTTKPNMLTTTKRALASSAALRTTTTTMMMLLMLALAFRASFVVEATDYSDGALFRENFETSTRDGYKFDGHGETQSYQNDGSTGNIFRASYPPNKDGSPRLVKRTQLNRAVSTATTSFDMKLDRQFEFVKGGKLNGIGGGKATTGCEPIDPNGWSVRMMWRENGVPELYIYHQDRKEDCGDRFPSTSGFVFGPDTWYRIDIQVRMNSAVTTRDGYAVLFIDGVRQVEANNLRLTGNSAVQIDQFQLNTFYGGSDRSWSPSKTTYIYFDNMGCDAWSHCYRDSRQRVRNQQGRHLQLQHKVVLCEELPILWGNRLFGSARREIKLLR
jgi:hypothetical protein